MRRPKALIPAVLVIALLIVGVLAIKSRGDDNNPLTTTNKASNCAPLARADAAATKPGEPVSIDVLANDTDADNEPLVFQIIHTDGGTSVLDDGGTPTDAADDRLQFTPSDPPVGTATIEYQAHDPQGGFGTSTVAVYVSPSGALPPGVHSEAATDPVPEGTGAGGRCGASTSSTVTEDTSVGPVGPDTAVDETATTQATTSATTRATGSSRRTTTTKKSTKATTTTAKKSTTTTGDQSPGTTAPSQTTTTKKPTTTTPHTTSPPQTVPDCGPPQNTDAYHDCVRDHATPTTSP
jgi:hypothetical protein